MDRLLAPLLKKIDGLADRIGGFQASVDGNTSAVNGLREFLEVAGLVAVGMFAVYLFVWWNKA